MTPRKVFALPKKFNLYGPFLNTPIDSSNFGWLKSWIVAGALDKNKRLSITYDPTVSPEKGPVRSDLKIVEIPEQDFSLPEVPNTSVVEELAVAGSTFVESEVRIEENTPSPVADADVVLAPPASPLFSSGEATLFGPGEDHMELATPVPNNTQEVSDQEGDWPALVPFLLDETGVEGEFSDEGDASSSDEENEVSDEGDEVSNEGDASSSDEGDEVSDEGDEVPDEGDEVPDEGDEVSDEGDEEALAKMPRLFARLEKVKAEGNEILAKSNGVIAERDKILAERGDILAEGDALFAVWDELIAKGNMVPDRRDALLAKCKELITRLGKNNELIAKGNEAPAKGDEVQSTGKATPSTPGIVIPTPGQPDRPRNTETERQKQSDGTPAGGAVVPSPNNIEEKSSAELLIEMIIILQDNIRLKKNHRWNLRNSEMKIGLFNNIIGKIDLDDPPKVIHGHIEEIRKVCAIHRNPFQFFYQPTSVGEFEKLLQDSKLLLSLGPVLGG